VEVAELGNLGENSLHGSGDGTGCWNPDGWRGSFGGSGGEFLFQPDDLVLQFPDVGFESRDSFGEDEFLLGRFCVRLDGRLWPLASKTALRATQVLGYRETAKR